MPVPRLVVQEWVSPAHWQPHLGASRAPWTPEPRAQKEVSNENGSVTERRVPRETPARFRRAATGVSGVYLSYSIIMQSVIAKANSERGCP